MEGRMPCLSCQRILFLSTTAVLFSLSTPAQQKVDCARFQSAGCNSFNELVGANDTGNLGQINSENKTARVCFVEGEDNFSILSYGVPSAASWRKDKDG